MPVVFYNRAYSDTEKNQARDLANPQNDSRSGIKILNIIVLIIGLLVGAIGFYIVGLEIYSGKFD